MWLAKQGARCNKNCDTSQLVPLHQLRVSLLLQIQSARCNDRGQPCHETGGNLQAHSIVLGLCRLYYNPLMGNAILSDGTDLSISLKINYLFQIVVQ